MTLSLNFFIIASFYDLLNEDGQESSNRYTPSLFYGDGNLNNYGTNNIITILGTKQCVCSVLIVSFFIIKTAPLLIKRGWKKHKSKNASKGCLRNLFVKLKNLLLALSLVLYGLFYTWINLPVVFFFAFVVYTLSLPFSAKCDKVHCSAKKIFVVDVYSYTNPCLFVFNMSVYRLLSILRQQL